MMGLEFELDPTGFPMVWVDVISAYMHWIPVPKIQFEYFVCAAPEKRFDANWYDGILLLNPRISPNEIRADNYWHAFLTGITPSEAQRFAQWCGTEYTIPTSKEWFEAYRALRAVPPESFNLIDNKMGDLRERVRTMLARLETASRVALEDVGYERTLADQMLMRMGVMEWVECREQRLQWGGLGEVSPRFSGGLFTPDSGYPDMPRNPETERLHTYGLRLVRRPV